MGRSYNKVIMIGRTTKMPEIKMGKDGSQVAIFTLAVDKNTGNNETDFFRCIAFGKVAEIISKYVGKGALILIEGEITINKWQDRNGNFRENAEIIVRNVTFLDTRSKDVGEVESFENIEKENVEEIEKDLKFEGFEDLLDDDFDV
jgi:single-strand DNA-binding protein